MVEAAGKDICTQAVMGEAGNSSFDTLIAHIAVLWSREDRKTPVSRGDQMINQNALAARRVAEYAGNRVILGETVIKYYRDMVTLELLKLRNGKAGGGDGSVNPIAPQLRKYAAGIGFVLKSKQ